MNEFKGTKGKWIAKENATKISGVDRLGIIGSKENMPIMICIMTNNEETKANAKLISCAPKMLEALDKINKLVYANAIAPGDNDYFAIRNICCDLIKEATE